MNSIFKASPTKENKIEQQPKKQASNKSVGSTMSTTSIVDKKPKNNNKVLKINKCSLYFNNLK